MQSRLCLVRKGSIPAFVYLLFSNQLDFIAEQMMRAAIVLRIVVRRAADLVAISNNFDAISRCSL